MTPPSDDKIARGECERIHEEEARACAEKHKELNDRLDRQFEAMEKSGDEREKRIVTAIQSAPKTSGESAKLFDLILDHPKRAVSIALLLAAFVAQFVVTMRTTSQVSAVASEANTAVVQAKASATESKAASDAAVENRAKLEGMVDKLLTVADELKKDTPKRTEFAAEKVGVAEGRAGEKP